VIAIRVIENLPAEIESDARRRIWSGFVLGHDGSSPSDLGSMPDLGTCFLLEAPVLPLFVEEPLS
jgi:hypothetical protein